MIFETQVLPNLLIDVDDMGDDVGARPSYMSRIEATYKEVITQQNEKNKYERLAKFHALKLELQNLLTHNSGKQKNHFLFFSNLST